MRSHGGRRRLMAVASASILVTACFDGELENFALQASGSEGLPHDSSSSDAGTSTTSSGMGGEDVLVDDFEDGDTQASNGFGWWYTTNDTTGEQGFRIAEVLDRPEGMRAANSSGTGFDVWGALVGLDLTPGEGTYDARAFNELRFWARATPDSVTALSARLLEGDLQFEKPIELSTDWQEYVLEFQSLSAVDGSDRIIDSSRLVALQFFVFSDQRFEFWIDDVVFVVSP